MDIPYQLVRSDRKSIGIEVKASGEVIVRAPRRASLKAIERVLEDKRTWIEKSLKKMASRPSLPPLTDEEKTALVARAQNELPERVTVIAQRLGVDYRRVTVRLQRTRWGSCSSKGNLNFNALLLLVPPAVLDYIIVHELCHRKELNHSHRFWALVADAMPNYKTHERWLKENGAVLMRRL